MHGTPTLPSNGKTLPFVVFMVCPNQRGFLYDVSGKILNPHTLLSYYKDIKSHGRGHLLYTLTQPEDPHLLQLYTHQ